MKMFFIGFISGISFCFALWVLEEIVWTFRIYRVNNPKIRK